MSALLFLSLSAFRLLNALLIQTQFDPDEYWQCLEVAYCHVFRDDCFQTKMLTWEWTRRAAGSNWLEQSLHGPVRSHISILPTYLWYQFVKFLDMDTSFAISKEPMLLHAVLVAATTDYCVWCLASKVSKQTGRWALFCSITSWFNAYALVRTYSNSIEAVLLIAGMLLLSNMRLNVAFVLGGLSVANRFTSLAAWIPIGILAGMQRCRSWKSRLAFLFYPCATYGLVGFGLSLVVDRYFYGFWTVPVVGNFHFNVLEGMGSLYGTHPWHWYLIAGLPVISGLLLPAIVYDFTKRGYKPMWIIIVVYLLLHSLSEHKEFRFILPILPLLCIVGGHTLSEQLDIKKRRLLRIFVIALFVVANLIAFVYLGIIHQRAPLTINRSIVDRMAQQHPSVAMRKSDVVSVHYLMGCHSAPIHSHLHVRGDAAVDTWHLDCSPSCRRRQFNSKALHCESDVFQNDPVGFVQDFYTTCTSSENAEHSGEKSASVDGQTCEYDNVPTFIAIFDSDSIKVKPQLEAMGLYEVGRFFHSIGGARIGSWNLGDLPLSSDSSSWSPTSWLEIHANEMVLYQRPN